MSDTEDPRDDRDLRIVTDAFAAFRDGAREDYPPPPIQQVYAEAEQRQRARWNRTWLATAAALVPAVTLLAASTALDRDPSRPGSGPTVTAPTETPSATQSGSQAPGPGKSSRPPGKRPPGVWIDLANATVELPALQGCPGGLLDFNQGQASDPGGCAWRIGAAVSGDLDGAAGAEIVTTVSAGEVPAVVALWGPASGAAGHLSAMGYVVADPAASSVAVAAVSGGVVTVTITAQGDAGAAGHTTRSYRWTGQGFEVVDPAPQSPDPEPEPSNPPTTEPADPDPGPSTPGTSVTPSPTP